MSQITVIDNWDKKQEGTGEAIARCARVTCNFHGYENEWPEQNPNTKRFDSTEETGKPIKFVVGVGQVPAGFDQGVLGMKKGEKKRFTVP